MRQFLLILLTFVVLNCQFIQAQTGHDPNEPEEGVLQVMPWAFFRHMTNSDLRAIYEYLRAIPHAEPGTCSGPGQ